MGKHRKMVGAVEFELFLYNTIVFTLCKAK